MSDTPAIRLQGVGLRFQLNTGREVRLRRDGIRALRSLAVRKRKSEFWALKDLSLEIPRGEIFGVIGGNGAGKSSLLKIMAGIYPATTGIVEPHGVIAPLIELGAAFNPELTGAENIFLTGSIYRIPRKVIREHFDRIVDFAGLGRFINVPIKNYSSGMFIRLAFSIIIFFRPDIVLIDEVFSVGDEVFQQKSFEKILSFRERGAAIVLVSHDLNLISQIASRVLVLERGRPAFLGPTEEAIAYYHDLMRGGGGLERNGEESAPEPALPVQDSRRWGDQRLRIKRVWFADAEGKPQTAFRQGGSFEARLEYESDLGEGEIPVFGVAIHTAYKMLIYGPNTLEAADRIGPGLPKRGTVRFTIPNLPLFHGDYLFSASAYEPGLSSAYDHHEMMYAFRVMETGRREFGCVKIDSRWDVESA